MKIKFTKKQIKEIIFKKYNCRCAYCGVKLINKWDIDHIKPRIDGGLDDIENLNPSCKECNNYKSHLSLEAFRIYLKQMLNDKLDYLFKSKTKMIIAMNMNVIKHFKWDGVFYFERNEPVVKIVKESLTVETDTEI